VVPHIYNVFTARHIQASIFNWMYLRCYWKCLDNSMLVILQTWCQIHRTSPGLRYVNCSPGHIQCICSSAYSDFNIHLNASALLSEICRYLDARYTVNLVRNTAQILRFKLCELWPRKSTMHLNLRIFSLQYSSAPFCAAIGDNSTTLWALYWKHGAKYRAHSPVYALWTVVPAIYKVLTFPHI
jgi:hypothetical protein